MKRRLLWLHWYVLLHVWICEASLVRAMCMQHVKMILINFTCCGRQSFEWFIAMQMIFFDSCRIASDTILCIAQCTTLGVEDFRLCQEKNFILPELTLSSSMEPFLGFIVVQNVWSFLLEGCLKCWVFSVERLALCIRWYIIEAR